MISSLTSKEESSITKSHQMTLIWLILFQLVIECLTICISLTDLTVGPTKLSPHTSFRQYQKTHIPKFMHDLLYSELKKSKASFLGPLYDKYSTVLSRLLTSIPCWNPKSCATKWFTKEIKEAKASKRHLEWIWRPIKYPKDRSNFRKQINNWNNLVKYPRRITTQVHAAAKSGWLKRLESESNGKWKTITWYMLNINSKRMEI